MIYQNNDPLWRPLAGTAERRMDELKLMINSCGH